MGSVPALDALKDRLRRPVGLRDVPALGTLLARIARVNKEHGHSGSLRLILNKGAQLRERPARELSTLLPSSPHPRTYPRQIFQGYRPPRAFGKLNKLFADHMVRVGCEATLFAGKLLQAALCGARVPSLKLGPQPAVPVSDGVDLSVTTDSAIRVGGDVLDSEVYTDDPFRDERFRLFDFAHGKKIEVAASIDEVCFPNARFQELHLSLSGHERNTFASGHGPDAHGRLVQVPGEDAVIVGDGPAWFEPPFATLVLPVGVSDFGKTADHHLSGEPKTGFNLLVAEPLERELPESSLFPCDLGDVLARGVRLGKRLLQSACLLSGRLEFELGDELHMLKVYGHQGGSPTEHLRRGSLFSHQLSWWISREQPC